MKLAFGLLMIVVFTCGIISIYPALAEAAQGYSDIIAALKLN